MTMRAPCLANSSTIALPMPLLPPVTTATFPFRLMTVLPVDKVTDRLTARTEAPPHRTTSKNKDGHDFAALGHPHALLLDPSEQMVADPQCIGHGRQRGVHRADAREKARID